MIGLAERQRSVLSPIERFSFDCRMSVVCGDIDGRRGPGKSVVWTKPEDLTIDPKKPLKDIAVEGSDRFLAARLDGSVKVVATRISAEVANALFSINGGELHADPRP